MRHWALAFLTTAIVALAACTDDEPQPDPSPATTAAAPASPSGRPTTPPDTSTPIPPSQPLSDVEGLPFGGADVTSALAAAGLDFPLQSDTVGCKGTGGSPRVYGQHSGPQLVLRVYRSASDLHADWDVPASGSPITKGISACPLGEGAVVHENLLLDFRDTRRWFGEDALRARITEVFLALDPANASPRVAIGHPPGTRTGNATVDTFVDAYLARDAERYRALARYQLVPCALTTTNEWRGPPPKCPDGVPGTSLEIMVVSSCHGAVFTREDLQRADLSTGALDIRLYAVAKAHAHPDPRVEYLVFFASRNSSGQNWGVVYEVGDGGFTSHHGGCGGTPQETIERHGAVGDFVLPPPAQQ